MQSVLKVLKSECSDDIAIRERIGDSSSSQRKSELPLLLLIVFMLTTTLIYMAWSINKIHNLDHSIKSIHHEKSEAQRKADFFFESVRKFK